MKVCIVDTERNHPKRYQIMVNSGTLFEHLFPGQLFTLCDAQSICKEKNYKIETIGTMWECLSK